MGLVCGKPSAVKDDGGSPRYRVSSKRVSQYGVDRAPSRREDGSQGMSRSDSKALLIERKASGSIRVCDDRSEISRVKPEDGLVSYVGLSVVPKAREAEQVTAGWPSWLAAGAGEAIRGWIPRSADSFEKMNKIGEGTYSSVYRARDLIHDKIVALKRVRFDNLDPESVKFMAREILILRRLDHPNIIKLEGLIASSTSCSLYLVFDYMEHDLTGLASLPGVKFTESQIKCYMKQLLSGLEHCHSHNVLHRDIKGSNLLIDDCGILRIADFGLATFRDSHQSQPLTSRVVTLWYRPPELLLGATQYGAAVDLWSTGCILGELYSGKPIMPGRTEVEQLHKIFKLCGSPSEEFWTRSKLPHSTAFRPQKPYRRRLAERFNDISAPAFGLIDTLLSMDPMSRGSASSALRSEYFTTRPFACDPSSLPKYPPSKEIDAKRREEENRRQQASESNQGRRGPVECTETISARVNAEFVSSLQEKKRQPKLMTENDISRSRALDPPRNAQVVKDVTRHLCDRGVHSGPLIRGANATEKKATDPALCARGAKLPTLPNLTTNQPSLAQANRQNRGFSRNNNAIEGLQSKKSQDWLYYSQDSMNSRQLEGAASIGRPPLPSYAPNDERIYLSGPLLQPSSSVDEMLREHDRRLQEAARRARLEKSRHGKLLAGYV